MISGEVPSRRGLDGISHSVGLWRGRRYHMKQVEVPAIWEDRGWLVTNVITKYF
jgi:hypothetical protein